MSTKAYQSVGSQIISIQSSIYVIRKTRIYTSSYFPGVVYMTGSKKLPVENGAALLWIFNFCFLYRNAESISGLEIENIYK